MDTSTSTLAGMLLAAPVSYTALAATSAALWIITLAVYRLWFHPLSKFPGPKIAALTLWYETYYDVWQRGKHIYKVKEMHEKYGRLGGIGDAGDV